MILYARIPISYLQRYPQNIILRANLKNLSRGFNLRCGSNMELLRILHAKIPISYLQRYPQNINLRANSRNLSRGFNLRCGLNMELLMILYAKIPISYLQRYPQNINLRANLKNLSLWRLPLDGTRKLSCCLFKESFVLKHTFKLKMSSFFTTLFLNITTKLVRRTVFALKKCFLSTVLFLHILHIFHANFWIEKLYLPQILTFLLSLQPASLHYKLVLWNIIQAVSEFNEFEPRLKSTKIGFHWTPA